MPRDSSVGKNNAAAPWSSFCYFFWKALNAYSKEHFNTKSRFLLGNVKESEGN